MLFLYNEHEITFSSWCMTFHGKNVSTNINGRDVRTKNVVNNADMSSLRAP